MAGRNGKWKDTSMSIKIKRKMVSKGMNMTKLAEILGISKATLALTIYEKRKSKAYAEYLSKVLEVLEIKEKKNKIA